MTTEQQPSSTHPLHLRRSDGPLSSHLAAEEQVGSGRNASQKALVLRGLSSFPGSTTAELAKELGLTRHIVGRRLPELVEDGLARRCPARKCTRTGRLATTWRPGRELTRRDALDSEGRGGKKGRPPSAQELHAARGLLRRALVKAVGCAKLGATREEQDALNVLGDWFRDLLGEEQRGED